MQRSYYIYTLGKIKLRQTNYRQTYEKTNLHTRRQLQK